MTSSTESTSKRAVQKIRKKAVAFLVLSCAVGAAALYLVNWYMGRVERETSAPAARMSAVIVAATTLPVGATLDETVLTVVPWPPDGVPEGSFGTLHEAVGRTLVQAAVKGEPILLERLADANAGRGLAALLEKGTRAMTVRNVERMARRLARPADNLSAPQVTESPYALAILGGVAWTIAARYWPGVRFP